MLDAHSDAISATTAAPAAEVAAKIRAKKPRYDKNYSRLGADLLGLSIYGPPTWLQSLVA